MFSRKLEPVRSSRFGSSAWVQGWTKVSGGSAIAIVALIAPAQAASLTNWSFDPNTNHLEVTVKDGTQPHYFVMAQPARIVLDLPGTSIAGVKTQGSYDGAVRQVRVSQFQPNVTRIVLELAPNTRLAAGQVNLQKPKGTSDNSRWVLRPLLVDSTIAANPTVPQSTPVQLSSTAEPPVARPTEGAIVPPALPSATASTPTAPAGVPPAPSSPAAMDDLPQSPGAIVPPVPPAPDATPSIVPAPIAASSGAIVPPALPSAPNVPPAPDATPPIVPAPIAASSGAIVPPMTGGSVSAASSDLPQPPVATPASSALPPSTTAAFPTAAAPASLEIPSTLPTAPVTPTITVPSPSGAVNPASPGSSADLVPTQAQSLPTAAPPSTTLPEVTNPGTVTVPPLQSPASTPDAIAPSSAPAASAPTGPISAPPTTAPAIEFGQPLPDGALRSSRGLTAGTLLSLRYPGPAALKLQSGTPHQEVLLLHSEVRDEAGNLIAPKDSMVVGRFETDRAGSRFVAQAISLQGRSVPLVAQSEVLTGSLRVSDRNLAVNSGIGAIAGGLIGGFSGAGIAGGAAVGATATLLTAPKPATVQPGQIVQIRLLQDLR